MQIIAVSLKRCKDSDWEKGFSIECRSNNILIDRDGFYLEQVHDIRYEMDMFTLKLRECDCNEI